MFKLLLGLQLIVEPLLTTDAVVKRYGPLAQDFSWPSSDNWLVQYDFTTFNPTWQPFLVNKDIALPLTLVLNELQIKGLLREIGNINGCYAPRAVRGTKRFSIHAYGLGCDLNSAHFSDEFIAVWEKYGWCWGGRWVKKKDYMHFSYTKYECWQAETAVSDSHH